jgi:hypothetical protein
MDGFLLEDLLARSRRDQLAEQALVEEVRLRQAEFVHGQALRQEAFCAELDRSRA